MTVTPDQTGEPAEAPAGLPVIVIGGGLSGIACARRLHDAGEQVVVWERAHHLGGRMAVRTEQLATGPHAVDTGAPYFTVRDEDFGEVVHRWAKFGRAQGWTDTFTLATPDGWTGATTSPLRWSATHGMRSLVEDLAAGLDVRLEQQAQQISVEPQAPDRDDVLLVDGVRAKAVVLAMPDPQASRLLTGGLSARLQLSARAWVPVLTVWAAWPERWWPDFNAIFVDGSSVLSWVSDDGSSRGDQAPVLVAHTTSDFARAHLDDAPKALRPAIEELARVVGGQMPEPLWARVHRWSLASSRHPHPAPFALEPAAPGGTALIGVCGDGWGERSRVEQAWQSGDKLASALLKRLAVSS